MKIYINGKFYSESRAKISVFDRGFLYGDGIYETMRVYKGRLFLWDKHLNRLRSSARKIHLLIPMSNQELTRAVTSTVKKNKLKEGILRLSVTRGESSLGFDPSYAKKPSLVIIPRLFHPYPLEWFKKGIVAAIVTTRRNSPYSLPPGAKSLNTLNNILAKREAIQAKAQEGIMLSREGYLTEGTVSNLFCVRKGKLLTPKMGITGLKGTTQEYVIELAKKSGLHVSEKNLTVSDLKKMDEMFLTNTSMEIMPVTRVIDMSQGKRGRFNVGGGKVGTITHNLMEQFRLSLWT